VGVVGEVGLGHGRILAWLCRCFNSPLPQPLAPAGRGEL
jgi:hypothetical protein